MILRGVNFGNVFCASGARNFYGDGWWYHRMFGWLGLRYEGSTLIAKTTTLEPRAGNMPLDGTTPQELVPACIKVRWFKGVVLNSVGLSGPGALALFQRGTWYNETKPFFLSFMSAAPTRQKREVETRAFVEMMKGFLPFKAPIGLQMNFSCPNVGLDPKELAAEIRASLDYAESLGIPLIPKVNATFPHEVILPLADHPAFDALSVSNTIPWGKLDDQIPWTKLFGKVSPLAHIGGGGLSGKPLLPIVARWIADLRRAGFQKPILGGGGVLSCGDADRLLDVGADAIELGSVSILRPWRVQDIIRHVNLRAS